MRRSLPIIIVGVIAAAIAGVGLWRLYEDKLAVHVPDYKTTGSSELAESELDARSEGLGFITRTRAP